MASCFRQAYHREV